MKITYFLIFLTFSHLFAGKTAEKKKLMVVLLMRRAGCHARALNHVDISLLLRRKMLGDKFRGVSMHIVLWLRERMTVHRPSGGGAEMQQPSVHFEG